jgi:hypothetical protein
MFILYKNIHTKKRQRKLKILYVHFLYVHVSLSQIPNPIGLFDTFFVIAATQPFSKDDVCYNSPPHLFWPIGVGHMTSDFVRPIVANIILTQMLRCRNGKVLPIYKNTLWLNSIESFTRGMERKINSSPYPCFYIIVEEEGLYVVLLRTRNFP